MARCSCAGSSCSCTVQAGDGLSVTGTGSVESPFRVSLSSPFESVLHGADGPLDLGFVEPSSYIALDLNADVTDVTLPLAARGSYDLFVKQGPTPHTITWPAEILWPGGVAPTLTTIDGHGDVIRIRRLGDMWVGSLTDADIG